MQAYFDRASMKKKSLIYSDVRVICKAYAYHISLILTDIQSAATLRINMLPKLNSKLIYKCGIRKLLTTVILIVVLYLTTKAYLKIKIIIAIIK
jgi:hypothetical protein